MEKKDYVSPILVIEELATNPLFLEASYGGVRTGNNEADANERRSFSDYHIYE